MDAHIRPAVQEDSELIARLIRESFCDVADKFNLSVENCPTHPAFCSSEWIDRAMGKEVRFFVLERDGTPGGCVAMEKPKPGLYYLERLAVVPEFRRNGFGRELVGHVLNEARRLGAARVELAMIAAHAQLRRWYESQGFIAFETKTFPHLPFDVLFMGIDLS